MLAGAGTVLDRARVLKKCFAKHVVSVAENGGGQVPCCVMRHTCFLGIFLRTY